MVTALPRGNEAWRFEMEFKVRVGADYDVLLSVGGCDGFTVVAHRWAGVWLVWHRTGGRFFGGLGNGCT